MASLVCVLEAFEGLLLENAIGLSMWWGGAHSVSKGPVASELTSFPVKE